MARSCSQRHPSVSPQIDRSALKVASDPRKLLAPLPIPAATPASSALQCAEKRRGGARLTMHDDGSAGRASAGQVAPYSRVTCRRQPRAAADGGAVGAAAAAPPVGGALVVAWAALRRRSARPGSGGSRLRGGAATNGMAPVSKRVGSLRAALDPSRRSSSDIELNRAEKFTFWQKAGWP